MNFGCAQHILDSLRLHDIAAAYRHGGGINLDRDDNGDESQTWGNLLQLQDGPTQVKVSVNLQKPPAG